MAVYKVALLSGDGIGPEVVAEATKVLEAAGRRFGLEWAFEEAPIGGAAIDAFGEPLPEETLRLAKGAGAVLLGAVGGPKWDDLPGDRRPEAALLRIRKELGLYANLRPATVMPALAGASALRREVVLGIDLIVVRELTGGLYFGEKGRTADGPGGASAYDTLVYSEAEVERIARVAFDLAARRRKRLASVDKANVLESSRLWRSVVERVRPEFPDVQVDHLYVDNCAMQLIRDPSQFDVIVTENMFGDILSDEAAMLTGSLGMLPSASVGGDVGLYEPVHGSAPDIAGTGQANPLATILSAAMMLRLSFGQAEAAGAVERAVADTLAAGYRTGDLIGAAGKGDGAGKNRNGEKPGGAGRPGDVRADGAAPRLVGTREMGDLVADHVEKGGVSRGGSSAV